MKTLFLAVILLTQTACAMLEPYKLGHADRVRCRPNDTFSTCDMYDFMRQKQAENAKQWAEWDRKYVPDDVVTVVIETPTK